MTHIHKEPETPDERRALIADVKEQIRIAQMMMQPLTSRLRNLIETCPHEIVCSECLTNDPECKADRVWGHGGAECSVCEYGSDFCEDLGWYCPDSPDHLCHYTSIMNVTGPIDKMTPEDAAIEAEHRKYCFVELINKQKHFLPLNHDWRGDSPDWCIFCHQPDERK
jgi:hypothetical protein